ncbi:MAG: sigma-54 dependent transcriptional regulator, partial [Acidobacteriota bacterium]
MGSSPLSQPGIGEIKGPDCDASVLVIDDDQSIRRLLSGIVERMGYHAVGAGSAREGVAATLMRAFDVVFLDVRLPDQSGLEILPEIRSTASAPEVIIITGAGDPAGAEMAIKGGAWDYVEKQSPIERQVLSLVRALQYRMERRSSSSRVAPRRDGIIGSSSALSACLDQAADAALTDANVLITGETGTGKELFARAIHQNSRRHSRNFVVVDCAALPESLVESSLFGYEKGAFTGADRTQDGLIKQADKGTLFLDEVGELPPSMQKAFLRVLQERRYRRIGGKTETESDFRLIAATNRDLETMVHSGGFRDDLLFRLQTVAIELPPLRVRAKDVEELVVHHVTRLCNKYEMQMPGFSPEFLEAIEAYDWPGNVRELVNALERALAMAQHDPVLFEKHLPTYIRVKVARNRVRSRVPKADGVPDPPDETG